MEREIRGWRAVLWTGDHGGVGDLDIDELRAVGGTWSGLLFENPATGYPLTLTWTFTVEFSEIERDYGGVAPSLTVDWIPAVRQGGLRRRRARWDDLAGKSFIGRTFADPIEASFYYFEHYRMDRASVMITNQMIGSVEAEIKVAGDIDGLGLPEVTVASALDFEGIRVPSKRSGTDVAAARDLLSRFCKIDELRPTARGHTVIFEPVES